MIQSDMGNESAQKQIPDHTAIRTSLWRAYHAEFDEKPLVLDDSLGAKLIAEDKWRERGDMVAPPMRGYRASIVARARLTEDLVLEKHEEGIDQYVILGAGLDTFAQRHSNLKNLRVFEIDQPETQAWKKRRLEETGIGSPATLKFVPVDFERGESWVEKLSKAGFDTNKPAVISSLGVSMYLTREAIMATLRQIAGLAPRTTFAMTFMLPVDMVEPEDRKPYEMVMERTAAAGTPFLSLLKPDEILAMAKEAGFKTTQHVGRREVLERYFAGRSDGLKPSSGEDLLIATT